MRHNCHNWHNCQPVTPKFEYVILVFFSPKPSMAIWQNENRDSIGPRPLCLCSIGTVQDQYTVYSKKYRYHTGPAYRPPDIGHRCMKAKDQFFMLLTAGELF